MKINPFAFNKKHYKPYDQLHTLFPYLYFLDDTVVLQKDGILQSVLKYSGNDIETLNESQIQAFHDSLNAILKRYGSEFGFYFDCIRCISNEYPVPHEFNNEALMLIESERHYYFSNYSKTYQNEYYINITFKPNMFFESVISNFSESGSDDDNEKILRNFKEEIKDIVTLLSNYVTIECLDKAGILNYFYKAVYLKSINIQNVQNELFFIDSIFANPVQIQSQYVFTDNTYIGYLTFVALPSKTYDAMLFALNEIDIEYRLYIRWLPFSQDEATKYLEKYAKYNRGKTKSFSSMVVEGITKEPTNNTNIGYEVLANQANEASIANTTGEVAFGFLSLTISVYAETKEKLYENLSKISKIASTSGLIIRHDKLNVIGSFLGMIPGNLYGNIRRYIMTTHNVLDFVPFFSSYQGQLFNKIAKSHYPHVICTTKYKSMFYHNLCVGDVGHALVVGPTGAGKSVYLSFIALEYTKYKDARVVIFDKHYSSMKATFAVEGGYFDLGHESVIRIQPLRKLETESDMIFAGEFIELLLEMQNVKITPEDKAAITEAIKTMKTVSPELRSISTFTHYVNNSKIITGLKEYTKGNRYGSILDGIEQGDFFANPNWIVFEMEKIMSLGKQILLPVILYIFHMLDSLFIDNRPTLLILDECWLFFDNDIMKNKIKEWLKVLRKQNVSVIFATQEISDMYNSGIFDTLVSQVPNKIFLPNNEAMLPSVYKLYTAVGLTDTEIRLLNMSVPKQDYYIKTVMGSRMFNLALGDIALALVTMNSDGSDYEFLKSIETAENKLYSIISHYNMQEYYKTLRDYYISNFGGFV